MFTFIKHIFLCSKLGFELPDPKFVSDIVNYSNREGIFFHLPSLKISDIRKYQNSLRQFSDCQFFSFLHQNNANSTKNGLLIDEDLHIYIIDTDNTNESIQSLLLQMKNRLRTNKETWFIDISAFENIENSKSRLNTLPLDIDDDIFLFMFKGKGFVNIWEIYKMTPEKDLIVNNLGKWTKEKGLNFTALEKWQRRGDLSVSL